MQLSYTVRIFWQYIPLRARCAGHSVEPSKAEVSRVASLLTSMVSTPWRKGLFAEYIARIFS